MTTRLELIHHKSLGAALWQALDQFPEHIALIEVNREREQARLSYRQLKNAGIQMCHFLRDHRLQPGDPVAILMPNQAKWLISALAVFWNGGIIVPIDYKLTPAEQHALILHARAKALIVDDAIWQRWLKERLHLDITTIVSESAQPNVGADTVAWPELYLQDSDTAFSPMIVESESIACIVYSSGTGGTPKGCMLSHRNYLAQAEVLGNLYPIQPKDRYFSVLPTNHAIDFMCGFILPLQFGSAIVHQRTLRPEFLSWTMQTYDISHIALVPMILKTLQTRVHDRVNHLAGPLRLFIRSLMAINRWLTRHRPCYKVSRRLLAPLHKGFGGKLRLIFAGGSFVDGNVAQFFYDIGIPVLIGYGLTEAGTVLTVNTLDSYRTDSVGRPIPGVELRIHEANDHGVGEVWVKGPTVMQGYLHEPELTAQTIVDGWLRTGDLAVIDSDGHVRLVGRRKNMIVTEGGKNIYPEDIEMAFDNVDEAQEHCIFARQFIWPSTALGGDSPQALTDDHLLLVVRPKEDIAKERLLTVLQQRNRHLSDYKRISTIVVWPQQFPRTASMKIKREHLAKQLAEHSQEDLTIGLT